MTMQQDTPSTTPASRMAPPAGSEQQQSVNRACESCRILKVRCLPDESTTSGICQRCSKSGRNCVFAAPQKRRQRKRTDTRVAELEKEVRAMRLLLEKGGTKSIPEEEFEEDKDSDESDGHDAECARTGKNGQLWTDGAERDDFNVGRMSSTSQSRTPNDDDSSLTSFSSIPLVQDRPFPTKDVIDRGIVSAKVADKLFESYNDHLVQHFPGVLLPPTCTASELRRSKPALFLAVICAACCNYDPDLYSTLFEENTRLFAERIFMNGEKSLELVQALTVTSVWYCPPHEVANGNTLRFYQYIHMAATMALDIGLGTQIDPSAMSLEKSRAICTCYVNCAGVAMRMRRPNMLRWTSWMSQCLELLEKSPASSFLDTRLAAWVKLQILTDDYANFFSFEDPSTTVNLADTRMQVTLKGFERQLEDWKRNTPPDVLNESLIMSYHQNSIYLHERIAIDGKFDDKENFNHKIFNPPQAISTAIPEQYSTGPLSAAYVNAVMACIESMHSLLDVFLSFDIDNLRTVPIVIFVRMSYSIVVLIKVYISTYSGDIGKVLDRKVLKVSHYLEACMERLKVAAGGKKYRVPNKWLTILREIAGWYHKYDDVLSMKDGASAAEIGALQWNKKPAGECPADTIPSDQGVGSLQHSFRPLGLDKSLNDKTATPDIGINSEIMGFSRTGQIQWTAPNDSWSTGPQAPPSQMGAFDPFAMDFAPSDFSFLDQPGGLDGNATWMTENMVLGDMSFDPSGGDWNTQFMNT